MANKNVFQRGDTWYIRYDEPFGSDGKRKQRMISCKGMTKRQAEQKLRDILSELNHGTYIDPTKISVGQYMKDWLKRAESNVAPSTWEGYAEYVLRHIIPGIGGNRMDQLKPTTIQLFYDKLRESGRLDGKRGLTPKTHPQYSRCAAFCLGTG